MEKKIAFNDIKDATSQELKKTYKMTDRQLEQSVRDQLRGASNKEKRHYYQMLYGKRK